MKKKHVFSKKRGKNKKRGNMNTKKVILIIIVLALAVFVFTLIKPEEDETQITPPISGGKQLYQTCEEGCSGNNECLNGCYITTINKAVLDSDLNLCNTIKHDESKQSCLDQINLKLAVRNKDLSKCELIKSVSLKNICLKNAK